MKRNFRAIDELLVQEGTKVVSLARLSFLPFGVTNYFMGVTSLSSLQYFLGTCIYTFNSSLSIFIGTSFYAIQKNSNSAVGDMNQLTADQKRQSDRTQNIALAAELIFSFSITFITGYYAKDMVMQKLEKLDAKEDTPQNEQGMPQMSQ